jgi:choline dehydrogenase-like flavoprotein
VNINTNLKAESTYDAVVGKELVVVRQRTYRKGLKVLMLERGMNIEHITDYESAMKALEFEHAGNLPKNKNEHIQFKPEIIHTMKLLKMVGE